MKKRAKKKEEGHFPSSPPLPKKKNRPDITIEHVDVGDRYMKAAESFGSIVTTATEEGVLLRTAEGYYFIPYAAIDQVRGRKDILGVLGHL